MRKTKFDDVDYVGFDYKFDSPHILVLVQDEDVFLPVALDDISFFDNLVLFLKRNYPESKIVGLYQENGFRGTICEKEMVSSVSRFAS